MSADNTPLLLVRYSEDFGRMGGLEDLFTVTALELRALKAARKCYRGEVLGKHSEVTSRLNDETLKVLTDDAAFVEQAQSYGLVSRWNPFLEHLSETAFNSSGAEVFPDLSPEDLAALNATWGFDNKDD